MVSRWSRVLFCLGGVAIAAWAQPTPNVLLIVGDDLGLQLSCYGDPNIRTPHIDALAEAGTRFRTAYITQSSCSPSRASIFTGVYPHTHGHLGLAKPNNPPLREEFRSQTLPALLKRAGYRTGLIGKLHVQPTSAVKFDFHRNADLGPNGAREVRAMAEAAGKFLAADAAKPFFLMMSYVDPHHPFPPQLDGLPENPTRRGEVPAWPFQHIESEAVLEAAANYYSAVRRLDAGVGLLMAKLEASGQARNTLIILLGDNGPPFSRAKTTCYDAGLRTPFLIRWPGVTKPGLVSEAFVSSVDILPTILDAVGVPIPANVQGRSLRGVAAGHNAGWRTTLAGEFHQHGERPFFPRRALRDERYQIIHNLLAGKITISPRVDGDTASEVVEAAAYRGTPARQAIERLANPPEWELYDLTADPGQFQDLARDPAHAATLQRMQQLLRDWQTETNDPFLDPAALAKKHAEVNR